MLRLRSAMEWITTTTVLHDLRDFSNEAAWGRFVGHFRLPIASFGRSMGLSSLDAEDLAQQTLAEFADAFRRDRYDRDKGRLSSWLFGIAYRQALRLAREARREPAAPGPPPDEPAATAIWDDQWRIAILSQCLDRARAEFEPATFEAFELTVHRGLSPSAAARELGISVKAVYNAKHRVLKRVRELRESLESMSNS